MAKKKIAFGRLDLMRNDELKGRPKIKIGFVGGGPNSFIGYSHRLAARFDNRFEFVAGVFSRDINRSRKFGTSLGLDPSRCYDDYISMAKQEFKRMDGIQAFIENKVHIVCDKPLTATLDEAIRLEKLVKKHKVVFALTHNYSAYPMLREAKSIVEKGKIGKVMLFNVEYPQGYTVGLKKIDEASTLKWRLDKKMSGPSMILSEIGTHSYHLLRYVTNLEVKEVAAEVNSLSPELTVDDNAFLLLRMNNNSRGSIWVSSAATGGENGLKIRVYGNKGSIEWFQDDPNHLKFSELGEPTKIITRASKNVSELSLQSSRLAAGHPEGFFEAFANIYTEFAESIYLKNNNKNISQIFPGIDDGVKGIKFIFASKKSSDHNSKWIKL